MAAPKGEPPNLRLNLAAWGGRVTGKGSVIVHFCDKRPYPIIDYRALWSLGYRRAPTYTVALWMAYANCCRDLASATRHDMRTVDRALWQYSKDHQ